MRFILLAALTLCSLSVQGQKTSAPLAERAIVTPKRIERWLNNGEAFKDVSITPVVSGLPNDILKAIRSELTLENVLGEHDYRRFRNKGLENLNYKLTYNRDHILSFTFSYDDFYNNIETTKNFDLTNGQLIELPDLFLEDQMGSVANLVEARLQHEVEEMILTLHGEGDIKSVFSTHRPFLRVTKDDLLSVRGRDFTINESGITFFFHVGFHHVFRWAEPKGRYFIKYGELKPFLKPKTPVSQFLN